jgi:hypothetical protein
MYILRSSLFRPEYFPRSSGYSISSRLVKARLATSSGQLIYMISTVSGQKLEVLANACFTHVHKVVDFEERCLRATTPLQKIKKFISRF